MLKLKKSEIEYFRREFKGKNDLFNKEPKLHGKLKHRGLLNVIFGEYEAKPRGYWKIKENVRQAALECGKATEFTKKYPGAYDSAKDNGWYEELTAHMEPSKTAPTKIRCIETGEVFASQAEAARKMNLHSKLINSVLKGKYKSTGGYSFTYVNEDVEE